MTSSQIPTVRWAVLGTGWVSSRFARDLLLPHPPNSPRPPINHNITHLATSSREKGAAFFSSLPFPSSHLEPEIHTDYSTIYAAPDIDVVYIGTPHSLHKEQCLAAISAGKHVLCEKPICINASEAEEVIAAAEAKGVFLMEAVWTRFFPLVTKLKKLLHEEKVIGDVSRMFCDFGIPMNIPSLPPTHRYRDLALGGGALLDIGIYPLTLANLILDGKVGSKVENFEVNASMVLFEGADVEDVITLKYADGKIGILTASLRTKTPEAFCRVEGSNGSLVIEGPGASLPTRIKVLVNGEDEKVLEFGFGEPAKGAKTPMGFRYEADAAGWDILEGRKENPICPLDESLRLMKLMDAMRKQCGVIYPQDAKA